MTLSSIPTKVEFIALPAKPPTLELLILAFLLLTAISNFKLLIWALINSVKKPTDEFCDAGEIVIPEILFPLPSIMPENTGNPENLSSSVNSILFSRE